jgi:DnaJ homolog subfamily C member 8
MTQNTSPQTPGNKIETKVSSLGTDQALFSNRGDDVEDWALQRDALKMEGDNAYRNQHYSTALHHYTMALSLDPTNGPLLSNRSATYLKLNYKSKALQDAIACVETKTMGNKGLSRYAAALQSLHRYEDALKHWQLILEADASNAAAIQGQEICQQQLELKKKTEESCAEQFSAEKNDGQEMNDRETVTDDLDDFFDEVEEVTASIQMEKKAIANEDESTFETATQAILNHKLELGTAQEQVERLVLRPNYAWYNLNPFYVLDIPFTSSKVEISRRYKALSLLLHPDRYSSSTEDDTYKATENGFTRDQIQLAYDQVLNAKAILYDDDKLKHMRDLNEQGMKQGLADFQKQQKGADPQGDPSMTLEDFQRRATYRLFATIEHTRQQVLEREKSFHQTEQANSDRTASNERNIRQHDQSWQQSERVHTRIDDWRSFQSQKKAKKS